MGMSSDAGSGGGVASGDVACARFSAVVGAVSVSPSVEAVGGGAGRMPCSAFNCSTRLVVRPGCSLPTYAPRIIRSFSVSLDRGASRLLLLMCGPKTMARCSLLSELFLYKYRYISVPVVVGILARTSHHTSGNFCISFGAGSDDEVVSTGTLLAGLSPAGVPLPGVAGGVNAGLMSAGGGFSPSSRSSSLKDDDNVRE